MRCEGVRRELNALADGELTGWLRWRITRHCDLCASCAAEVVELKHLGEQARAWRDKATPASLKDRVATVLTSTSRAKPVATLSRLRVFGQLRSKERLTLKFALVLACVPVVILVIWAISARDNAALAALKRTEVAVSEVRSAHVALQVTEPDGRRWTQRELWYQQGRWRLGNSGPSVQIYRDGKLWSYKPNTRAIESGPAEGPPGRNWSAFTFKAIGADFVRWGPPGVKIRGLGTTKSDDREIAQYLIENADDAPYPTRAIVKVDARTDLPLQIEKQHQINGEWVTRLTVEFEFNQTLPERLFDPASLSDDLNPKTPRTGSGQSEPKITVR